MSDEDELRALAERAIEHAITLQQDGDLDGAARAFLEVSKITPSDHRVCDEAGNIYLYALERPHDAIPCFEQTLKTLPLSEDPGRVWLKLGLAHSLAGHDCDALDALSNAGKEDPTSVLCHLEFGKHHLSQRRYQDALEYFDTALAHFHMQHHFGSALGGPGMDPHLLALALMGKARVGLVHGRGDGMPAVRELFEALEDYGRGMKLATELVAVGRTAVAVRVLDELLARAPNNRAALALRKKLAVAATSSTTKTKTKTKTKAAPKKATTKAKRNAKPKTKRTSAE